MKYNDVGIISFSKEDADIKTNLEYFECSACGFHFALDAGYLLRVGDIDFNCFSCSNLIHIQGDTGLQGIMKSSLAED